MTPQERLNSANLTLHNLEVVRIYVANHPKIYEPSKEAMLELIEEDKKTVAKNLATDLKAMFGL